MRTALVPATSATVAEATCQVFHEPVGGKLIAGPAAPLTCADSVRVAD